jgi:monoterpene epsilon-lactone hydrolase
MPAATLPPFQSSERTGEAAAPDLLAIRDAITSAVDAGVWATTPPPQEITIAGIRALRFIPNGESRGTVLHFHGGGFRLGCPEQVGPFAAALAARCSVSVICPAYRLAPEHPFPAGLSDGWSVLHELEALDNLPLILSGDSAGGGLAASLAALSTSNTFRPAGLSLISPWLDLTVDSSSYQQNAASDPIFSAASAREAAQLYLQGHSPDDPLASPLCGSANGLPPTLINVGAGEVLLDDAKLFHNKLIAEDIPTQLHIVKDMEHVAVTRSFVLAGAKETFETLVSFISSRLSSTAE